MKSSKIKNEKKNHQPTTINQQPLKLCFMQIITREKGKEQELG